MTTQNPQQARTLNNAVPLDSSELITMTVKGQVYYVRPIAGFAGYFIATCGTVISCISGFNGKRDRITRDQPKLLRPSDNGNGYLFVRLYSGNGFVKRMYVHRIVAINLLKRPVFIKGLRYQVNHINQQKNDNRACNLEWVLPEENIRWNKVIELVKEERSGS